MSIHNQISISVCLNSNTCAYIGEAHDNSRIVRYAFYCLYKIITIDGDT